MSSGEAWRPDPSPSLRISYLGRLEYAAALELQESIHRRKVDGDASDELLLLEHPPVYTLGRGADAANLLDAPDRLGVPVYRVGRGGGATYHGPGQLVSYPVVRLFPTGRDVHRYVRSLEQVLIATCAALGFEAEARDGETGVWARGGKIGSIGIGVRRGIAFHGTSLNVDVDPIYFSSIVVCRTPEARVTSVRAEVGAAPDIEAVAAIYADAFASILGYDEREITFWHREPGTPPREGDPSRERPGPRG